MARRDELDDPSGTPRPLFSVNHQAETAVFPSTVDTRFVRIKFFSDYQSFVQINEVEVFGDL